MTYVSFREKHSKQGSRLNEINLINIENKKQEEIL